jgi:hypothetical protein
MPDSKHLRWDQDFGTEPEDETQPTDATLPGDVPAANDADGWQQYRRWISKAPAPHGRRQGIDPALYSWKGYREWTDQVRRNWSKDSTDDND